MRSSASLRCGSTSALTAADRLNVHGRLSTHVLDTHRGRPASGVAIELFEIDFVRDDAADPARTRTNADGRTDRPLIAEQPIPIAQYELRFWVGGYFAEHGAPTADPPFLDCSHSLRGRRTRSAIITCR